MLTVDNSSIDVAQLSDILGRETFFGDSYEISFSAHERCANLIKENDSQFLLARCDAARRDE